MCCPASVRNTNGTTHVLVITIFYQIVNLSLGLIDIQRLAVVNQCHTS